MTLVAGVDCSTQSTKVLVVDSDSGDVVARGAASHTVSGIDGARETDPAQWWSALREALTRTGVAPRIAAISVAGQQHGLVVVDDAERPLRPAILWNDVRSAPQAAQLIDELGGALSAAALLGGVPQAATTVTSWMWLRIHEPAVATATRGVRLPHDWLNARLTGVASTDRGDASGTGWWSSVTGTYVDEVLGRSSVALTREFLPAVLAPGDRAGEVTARAAAETGLVAGTPVACGTGDNAAAALGLALDAREIALSLGTSGTVYTVAERAVVDGTGTLAGFADATGRFLPLACTMNCTLAVDSFAALLGLGRDDVAPAGEVVVLPYLDGERTPYLPDAAGAISGLRHGTTRQQILMAAYEGAVVGLLDAVDLLGKHTGAIGDDAPILLIGGGARGATWQSVVRRLSGRPVVVPETDELVALGAAAQAAHLVGGGEPALAISRRWNARSGRELSATPLDAPAVERLRAVREARAHL